jgi:Ras-related protein Rab-32
MPWVCCVAWFTNIKGAMIVFDLTDASSFEAVEKWRDDMDRKMKPDPDIPILLVGNKVDIVQQDRSKMVVTEEAMDAICTRFENFIGWYSFLLFGS